ncbi:MAG: hypothetical protein KDD37_05695, partial [Bdellovibrionales bacterium]|nr:hypothetical protein [Bdellovibrionales bacterium]
MKHIIFILSVLCILTYQNCSDPTLSHIESTKASCKDLKNLRIFDSQNLNTEVGEPGIKDFALYYLDDDSTWKSFTPSDSSSVWPPVWYKNGVKALPTELSNDGVVFST